MNILFDPMFTPKEMLLLGVFDGSYFNDDLSSIMENDKLPFISDRNLFASNVSQSRQTWMDNGWITEEDPLGWFQWYTRYHSGRRVETLDVFQMKRWKSFVARHSAQVKKNGAGDITKRMRQRQCLLHWAADPIPDIDTNDKIGYLMEIKKGK